MLSSRLTYRLAAVAIALVLTSGDWAAAQLNLDFGKQQPLFDGTGDPASQVKAEAVLAPAEDDRPPMLFVTAKVAQGWYMYSLTQPAPPLKTEITVKLPEGVSLAAEFQPSVPPHGKIDKETWEGQEVPIEKHTGSVTFYAPLEGSGNVDWASQQIKGHMDWQACGEHGQGCIPGRTKFTAKVGKPPFVPAIEVAAQQGQEPAAIGSYRAENSNIAIKGHLEPATAEPGSRVKIVLRAVPDEGWHVYPLAATEDANPDSIALPTLIAVDDAAGLTAYRARTDAEPVTKDDPYLGEQTYHRGAVTWEVPIDIPQDAEAGSYPLQGIIGYQICSDRSCLPPIAVRFAATLEVAQGGEASEVPLKFFTTDNGYREAAERAAAWSPPELEEQTAAGVEPTLAYVHYGELAWTLLFALMGGLILNLMPCVLPVIGLKLLSFIDQSGQNRTEVLKLNLIYSAGMLLVFLALATLAVSLNLGWGEQFTHNWFKVALTALVFVMALSFLGVWEIPIPGFVGSGKASELAAQEGASGAFFKGVFTTVLATPCSGPFLGPVFGYTLNQPPVVTYLIFAFIGIGMASPYLVIGVFPNLVRWLPKPGAWMDTFKQVMGFVLLGTVVFLFSTINSSLFIPTLALMIGLWFACWLIGRTPMTASTGKRAASWLGGTVAAAAVGLFAFTFLAPSHHELDWQPYSPAALAKAKAEGKTVLLDFTADWCATCKVNSKFAINTADVKEMVEQNNVVPLLADWTDRSEEIKQTLAGFESKSIPLLVIFPAGKPDDYIKLPDLVSEQKVLSALKKAGPSEKKDDPERAVAQAQVGR